MNLDGKVAVVTGSGRGIGRAIALALGASGAKVVVSARTDEEIKAVAREIVDAGGDATAVPCDVSSRADVQGLVAATGPVDILVNNAGIIAPIAPLISSEPANWIRNIEINLNGVYLPCRFYLPLMMERGWGRVITVSSGAARGTTVGWSAYSAAKAGVEAMTGVLAREIEGADLRVNAIRPGIVDTDMQVEIRGSTEEDFGRANLERFRGYKERGQLRQPEDPARLVLWLLTPEAAEINGQVLAIDDPEIAAKIGLSPIAR